MTAPGAKPWYREFWLWFVLAPVIATVIAGFATLIIAGAPPSLVVDDFGQIAMAVEQDQARDRRAAELGLAATLQVGPDPSGQQEVRVRLAGDSPPQLSLRFVHPTREELDWRVALDRSGDGYRGLSRQPDTRVYLLLMDADESWRLTGELRPGERSVELQARGKAGP